MRVQSTVEAVDCPAAEQVLLTTIGRAGVLSCRAIAAEELETLLRLLGPPSERQRSDVKRATDVVLLEVVSGAWQRVSMPRCLAHMFGDHTEDEPEGAGIHSGRKRTVDRFLQ